ncbi:hypothetical protein [Capnocytophaga sp. oral taxon 878]|uniref:hypothetical protein n=1 Tax=Capnocytophaga sp. oral taxon 878 TaxID=1316596 RepID=UPI000D039F96|nr:hypothetical protein [Capnocytophaga sp. oral taxon 878]AVM49093.1 hypothetical protein C4H12_00625 [Capnocytophaga sp. oral taxon 878]
MENTKKPEIGDIYSLYLKRWDFYVSAQIVVKDDSRGTIAVLLDIFSKEVPTLDALKRAKPFVLDHHYWNTTNFYLYTGELWAFNPIFIGNSTPIDTPTNEHLSTFGIEQFSLQYQWNQLPDAFKKSFKEQSPRDKTIKITRSENKDFYTSLLQEKPLAYEVKSCIFDAQLQSFLKENQQVSKLELEEVDEAIVDISASGIDEIVIRDSHIEKIVLNRYIQTLYTLGDFSTIKEIVCPFEGELLHLGLSNFNSGYLKFKGLREVRSLSIFSDKNYSVDIAEIANTFPNLEFLKINGQNASLRNIEALAKLQHLESVWLSDLYDFDSFVKKTEMPNLRSISLWSVPKVVADKVKKEFKGIDELDIKQARTDEWIKANLDNPLRNWDGREGTKPSVAKKTMKAYTDAYKKLSGNKNKDEAVTTLQNFIAIFNEIDKKHHIDTLEREEIWEAFKILAELTPLSVNEIEDIFEDLRDF